MKITIYRTLSDAHKEIEVKSGTALEKALPLIDFDNAVAIVNGKFEEKDYILKEDDIVFIRLFPSGTMATNYNSQNAAGKAAYILTWIFCPFAAAVNEIVYYNQEKDRLAALQAKEEEERQKRLAFEPTIESDPAIKGASNSVATGNSQPYILGRMAFTPNYMMNPSYRLSSNKLHTMMYFELGFPNQIVRKVKSDELLMYSYGESEHSTPTEGTVTCTGVFAGSDNKIQVKQGARFLGNTVFNALNTKKAVQFVNTAIVTTTDESNAVVYTLDANTKSFDVFIKCPDGSWIKDSTTGYITAKPFEVYIKKSYDNGSTWTSATQIWSYSGAVSYTEILGTVNIAMSLAEYTTLQANGADSLQVKFLCGTYTGPYLMALQSNCFDPEKSSKPAGILDDSGAAGLVDCKTIEDREVPSTVNLGISLAMSDAYSEKLKKVNVVCQGMARTWDETNQEWSTAKTDTRNPAAWALEVLTSSAHTHSQFADSELDLDAFGEWFEYCDDNDYTFDYIVTTSMTKTALLEKIMEAGDGLLYWTLNGKLSVAVDCAKSSSIAIFNAQNIVSSEITKSFERQIDGLIVKYTSSDNDAYEEVTEIFMYPGKTRTANSTLTEITLDGITTHKHAYIYAHRYLAKLTLQPKKISLEVGPEGLFIPPLSKILVQEEALKIGLSSGTIRSVQVVSGVVTALELDNTVLFESGKSYGMLINCINGSATVSLPIVVTGTGRTNIVSVSTTVEEGATLFPEAGAIYSFGELDSESGFTKITSPFLVTGVSRNGENTTLTCVDYNAAIYTPGTIPEYKSNITEKASADPDPIPVDYVTRGEMYAAQEGEITGTPDTPVITAGAGRDYITVNVTPLSDGLRNVVQKITYEISKDSGTTWTTAGVSQELTYYHYFDRSTEGYPEASALATWKFRAKVTNTGNVSSAYSTAVTVSTSTYGTWNLTLPVIDRVQTNDRTVILRMSQTADNLTHYGTTEYRIEISRYDDKTEGVQTWYKPNMTDDPYGEETNYRDGTGYVTSGNVFTMTLPLEGQEDDDMLNTVYFFRVTATNESGNVSTSTTATATALFTSIRDIVKANETEKEAYISNLYSICANLGMISQGGLGDVKAVSGQTTLHNYWVLNDLETTETGQSRKVYKGEFRVGDTNQYIKAGPKIDSDGNLVLDDDGNRQFEIGMKASNIELSNTGLDFTDGTIIKNEAKKGVQLRLQGDGIMIENSDGSSQYGLVKCDRFGNMFVSNDPTGSTVPKVAISLTGSTNYHFKSNTNDEDGTNAESLVFSGSLVNRSYVDESRSFSGTITKDITSSANKMLVVSKATKIVVGNKYVFADGTSESALSFNDFASTTWGLTSTQIENNIFSKE